MRRRRRRRIVLLGVALLAAWIGRFAWLRITVRPTPRPEYWEAQLAALDPPPPGAVAESQAQTVLTNQPWGSDPAILALPTFHPQQLLFGVWKTARADTAAASRAFASRVSDDARREMLRVLAAGWAEPVELELDPNVPVGWSMSRRELCTWLLAHSRWAREETADPDAAADDWVAILQLARQIRRQQTAVAIIVEGYILELDAREMMLAAREGTTPANVRALAERIERIVGPLRTPRELISGERLATLGGLENIFVREGGRWMDVAEMVRLHGWAAWPWPKGAGVRPEASRWWNLTSPVFHDLTETTRRWERQWAELGRCVNLVDCRVVEEQMAVDTQRRIDALDGFPPGYFGGLGLTITGGQAAYARLIAGHYAARCALDAALTMLALAAYRERNGNYPETMAELVPDYLPRLPLDCADWQPLRYHRRGREYILYSLGVNGQDDGGEDWSGGRASFGERWRDVVFSHARREERAY